MKKTIILPIALIAIIGVIAYLELQKPRTGPAVSVQQSAQGGTSSSTVATPSSGSSSTLTTTQSLESRADIIQQKSKKYPAAAEIADPSGFINTPPFKLSDLLEKKVVLIDFWTYSCINCIRTIPYLNAWYQKYKDQGLVIVGVHTPEFDFEHDYANVAAAVKKYGIQYPVVLDNDMGTWNAYQNQYWPHEFLIDIDGFVVHDEIGEGNYDATEKAIQTALAERAQALGIHETIAQGMATPTGTIAIDYSAVGSPETYFGSSRNQYLANGLPGVPGTQTLTLPGTTARDSLYLGGAWNFVPEYATNQTADATIEFTYNAKNVYLVASAGSPVTITILRDGKPLGAVAGSDVSSSSTATIHDDRLYDLIEGEGYGTHTIRVTVQNPGLNAFTFTFG
jgi:thiol-disulfide isomerase/thioredoxin